MLQAMRETAKKRYERLKSQGICTQCRKRKARPGQVLCLECNNKQNDRDKRQRAAQKWMLNRARWEDMTAKQKTQLKDRPITANELRMLLFGLERCSSQLMDCQSSCKTCKACSVGVTYQFFWEKLKNLEEMQR